MNKSTIVDLESNKRAIHEATRYMVLHELVAAGINFTDDGGVVPREWPLKPYIPVGIASKTPRPEPPPLTGGRKKTLPRSP